LGGYVLRDQAENEENLTRIGEQGGKAKKDLTWCQKQIKK